MRIVYIGPFEHSWGTEEHVARAFETLGHNVLRFTEPAASSSADTIIPMLLDATADCDLVLYTKSRSLPPDVARFFLARESDTRTASFHLDLYRGLARAADVSIFDPFWAAGTVFTADGDPDTNAWMAERNINHQWLPPAVSHEEAYEGQWQVQYDHDVVFVGAGSYHREWPWRQTLIRTLARKYGSRFKHYDHHPPIRDGDLNDLYATARVVVGDSLALRGHRNYFSDRYFETVGRGGFLIGPNVPGIEDFFTDRQHLVLYDIGDTGGLVDEIDWYLDHPEEARRIAVAGQAHVRKHHTYVHRAEQMLTALGLTVVA